MMTRRNMLLGAAALSTAPGSIGEDEIAKLVELTTVSEIAWVLGEMQRYLSLISHSEDFTLMSPLGGTPRRGFDSSPARLAELSRFFRGGSGTFEVVQTYGSGGLVVLAMIFRMRAIVGGLPEQDWALRVTQVYRRDPSGWRLVHRHADPLLRSLGLEQAAALARG